MQTYFKISDVMKRRTIILMTFIANVLVANAQNIEEMYFNARGSFAADWHTTSMDKGFRGENFNFVMAGQLADNLSYRIRQRLNKNITNKTPFNATDFLYISWKLNNKLTFSFGKQEIYIGGFEYDYAPIDVYYWSEGWGTLPESYSFATSMFYHFNDEQQIIFQISNSPFYNAYSDNMSYNLAWFGQIAPWWKTIWSINESEFGKSNFQNIISLGNRFELNNWYLETDFVNRYNSNDKCDFLFSHWGMVGKLNYTCQNYNFFVKASYDNDNSFTNNLSWGDYNHTSAGCGVEYYPKNNKNLRLHAVYHFTNIDDPKVSNSKINTFLVGATWKLNIIKK